MLQQGCMSHNLMPFMGTLCKILAVQRQQGIRMFVAFTSKQTRASIAQGERGDRLSSGKLRNCDRLCKRAGTEVNLLCRAE